MEPNGAAWLAAGLVLSLLGVLSLREAWRRRGKPHAPWLVGGWALLLVAAVPFVRAASGESGVAVWMTVAGLLALAAIGLRTEWRLPPDRRRKPQRVSAAGAGVDPGLSAASTPWRTAAVVALALPVFGAASLLLGLGLVRRGPGGPGDQLMSAALITPLVWGLGMAWACADPRLTRSMAVAGAVAALGALLYLLP